MRRAAQIAVVFLTACFSTGCIVPWPRKGEVMVAPEIRGRVVDLTTGQAVAGAEVAVDHRAETVTHTAVDGSFHLSEQHKKYYMEFVEPGGVMGYCPPAGEIHWFITVTHPDYKAFEEHIYNQADVATSRNFNGPFVLRDIRLHPKQQ